MTMLEKVALAMADVYPAAGQRGDLRSLPLPFEVYRVLARAAIEAMQPPDPADPNVVHINMLRGTLAKPTWEQIKHLYPEARDLSQELDSLRESLAATGHSQEPKS